MGLHWYKNGALSVFEPDAPGAVTGARGKHPYGAPAVEERPRKPAIRVEDVMSSPVITLTQEATLTEALNFIRVHRFRHIPVVQNDQQLVGIVSDRDLLKEASRHHESLLDWISEGEQAGRKLKGFMTTKVLTGTRDTPIREAAEALLKQRIGSLPVLDDGGKLIGMLTRTDILRTIIAQAPLELWI